MWPLIDILGIDPLPKSERSAFRAIPKSIELNQIVEKLIDEKRISNRRFARILGVNSNSVQSWCGHGVSKPHPVPIWVINSLVSKIEDEKEHRLQVNLLIDKIRCGRFGTVQSFPRELNPEIASLIGAHAADGSVSKIPKRNSLNWNLSDSYKESVELAAIWIEKNFGLKLKIKKIKNANAWQITTRIQIIPRFFTNICDMPIGEKHGTVKEPSILENPENDLRLLTKPILKEKQELELSFAKGVMVFDGHCTKTGGIPSVGIGSNSNDLLTDLIRIFKENGIDFHDFTRHKKILTTSSIESKKFLQIEGFLGTTKQKKLANLLSEKFRINNLQS